MPVAAQDDLSEPQRGSVLPGFIINLNGDTVKGYLLNINLWMNQHMTFFYTSPDDPDHRIKYRPKEIKAYQVGNRFYESMKYPFSYSLYPYNFILRKVDGPIKHYIWYYNENRAKLMSPDVSVEELGKAFVYEENELWKDEFARKGDGELTPFDFKFLVKFAKNMAAYVEDDRSLSQKIKDKVKGYQSVDIERIVREYNEDVLKK
jgi:predicted nuclease of restriction endonuclease-like RecB superfamily